MLESLLDTLASGVLPPGHPPRRKGLGKVDGPLGQEGVSLAPKGSSHRPGPTLSQSCPIDFYHLHPT